MLLEEVTKNKLCLRLAVGLNRIIDRYIDGWIKIIRQLLGAARLNGLFHLINNIGLGN